MGHFSHFKLTCRSLKPIFFFFFFVQVIKFQDWRSKLVYVLMSTVLRQLQRIMTNSFIGHHWNTCRKYWNIMACYQINLILSRYILHEFVNCVATLNVNPITLRSLQKKSWEGVARYAQGFGGRNWLDTLKTKAWHWPIQVEGKYIKMSEWKQRCSNLSKWKI